MIIILLLQVLDDPAEDNLHMGTQTIFVSNSFTLFLPSLNLSHLTHIQPLSPLMTAHGWLPSTPPQGSHIMQKPSICSARSHLGHLLVKFQSLYVLNLSNSAKSVILTMNNVMLWSCLSGFSGQTHLNA